MTLTGMDYFVMIAQERSFTKAAEKLHITQQSLSAHIASLEQELGCQLVIRRVPLELTYAGQVFLKYALSFQKDITALKQEMCDITENQKGILRIGISFTRGRAIMPPLIEKFQQKYPNITIELVEASNEALQKKLLNREMDLAVANFPSSLTGIEMKNFYREKVFLFISKNLCRRLYGDRAQQVIEAVTEGDLSQLADCPFVMGNPEDIVAHMGYSLLRKAGIQPPVKVQSDNTETLLDLCLRDIGACFCPENISQAIMTPQQFGQMYIIPLKPTTEYQIQFSYLKNSYQWNIVSEFMRMAMEE